MDSKMYDLWIFSECLDPFCLNDIKPEEFGFESMSISA